MMAAMSTRFRRILSALDLEERILNAGSLVAVIGVLLPWISGQWGGQDEQVFSGLGFFTSFLGIAVLLLHVVVIAILVIPLCGGTRFVSQARQHIVRFLLAATASILLLAALSVLTKVTLEFPRMGLRFGIYLSLIGSLVSTLYTYLLYREQRRHEVRELFHHPEDHFRHVNPAVPVASTPSTPPPPPPPPLPAEEHPVIR